MFSTEKYIEQILAKKLDVIGSSNEGIRIVLFVLFCFVSFLVRYMYVMGLKIVIRKGLVSVERNLLIFKTNSPARNTSENSPNLGEFSLNGSWPPT